MGSTVVTVASGGDVTAVVGLALVLLVVVGGGVVVIVTVGGSGGVVSLVGGGMGVVADGVVFVAAAGGEHKDDTFNSSNHIITDGM